MESEAISITTPPKDEVNTYSIISKYMVVNGVYYLLDSKMVASNTTGMTAHYTISCVVEEEGVQDGDADKYNNAGAQPAKVD